MALKHRNYTEALTLGCPFLFSFLGKTIDTLLTTLVLCQLAFRHFFRSENDRSTALYTTNKSMNKKYQEMHGLFLIGSCVWPNEWHRGLVKITREDKECWPWGLHHFRVCAPIHTYKQMHTHTHAHMIISKKKMTKCREKKSDKRRASLLLFSDQPQKHFFFLPVYILQGWPDS